MNRIGAIFAGLCAAAALSGCADLTRATAMLGPAPLNVESPVAPAVQAAQTLPMRAPTFRDVPPIVAAKDQRTPFQWSREVQGVARSGAEIDAWAQENPILVASSTATFNAAALKALKYDPAALPPEDQAARSESYAASLRSSATPPPPPK